MKDIRVDIVWNLFLQWYCFSCWDSLRWLLTLGGIIDVLINLAIFNMGI
jgi:hypothetical protein